MVRNHYHVLESRPKVTLSTRHEPPPLSALLDKAAVLVLSLIQLSCRTLAPVPRPHQPPASRPIQVPSPRPHQAPAPRPNLAPAPTSNQAPAPGPNRAPAPGPIQPPAPEPIPPPAAIPHQAAAQAPIPAPDPQAVAPEPMQPPPHDLVLVLNSPREYTRTASMNSYKFTRDRTELSHI